jgi:peptidyl-tRNA hydrolase, PTH2 family
MATAALQPAAWLYFLSGALLPSIAYYFLWKRSEEQIEQLLLNQQQQENDDDDDDDDESDDNGGTAAKKTNKTAGGEDDDDDNDENATNDDKNGPSSWGMAHAPYKMVLIVNPSLAMGKGKIAAQCAHAAVGCYKRARRTCPAGLQAWEWTGCAKIAVKCQSSSEKGNCNGNSTTDAAAAINAAFAEIAARAAAKGIPMYLVEDAGRTQIAAGSKTVLGLGPAPAFVFEGVSDHLKLL